MGVVSLTTWQKTGKQRCQAMAKKKGKGHSTERARREDEKPVCSSACCEMSSAYPRINLSTCSQAVILWKECHSSRCVVQQTHRNPPDGQADSSPEI